MQTARREDSLVFGRPEFFVDDLPICDLEKFFREAPDVAPSVKYPEELRQKDWAATKALFEATGEMKVVYGRSVSEESDHRESEETEWLIRRGILPANAHASFDNYDISEPTGLAGKALATARSFATSKRPSGVLVLSGRTGSGKDHLAVAVARHLRLERTVFRNQMDVIDEIRATYGSHGNTHAVVDKFRSADLLILSDLGVEPASSDFTSVLARIVEFRVGNFLPTVITTNLIESGEGGSACDRDAGNGALGRAGSNLPSNVFGDYLGDRLASRLYDALFSFVRMPPRDYRRLGKARRDYFARALARA